MLTRVSALGQWMCLCMQAVDENNVSSMSAGGSSNDAEFEDQV